jgi:protein gp37/ParB-like chromosome segregation protein Spo0J
MSDSPKQIPLGDLHAHPDNPRLTNREDVVASIAAQIRSGFDPAHALIVRQNAAGWEILSGHHRHEAAKRVGLKTLPCWVRDLDDAEAYMLLVTSNAQSELTPIERGMHALRAKAQGIDVKAYAAKVGRKHQAVLEEVWAASVADSADKHVLVGDHFRTLAVIHAAPSWLWPALVEAMVAGGWTVEMTRKQVQRFDNVPKAPPVWAEDSVAAALVAGRMSIFNLHKIDDLIERTMEELTKPDIADDTALKALSSQTFASLSEAMEYCDRLMNGIREMRRTKQRAAEDADKRAEALREHVSLSQWKGLDAATQTALLKLDPKQYPPTGFNKQDNASIEWSMFSWNPVTGCEHTCSYCYARDIATMGRTAAAFPNGFEPTFYPRRLAAPRTMRVPGDAHADTRYRNVFMGSMSDVFGRWVPEEWIAAVLSEIRRAKEWNFLCLTKFPNRMAEFDIPPNAWMGTTVDLQARVAPAEAAFERVNAAVRWLSCEPLLEPLRFKHLDRFHWIVIGGSSRSSKTPEFKPPFGWIIDLVQQARDAGLKVYFKTNLLGSRLLELPFDAPIVADEQEAPAVFHYLKGKGK